MARRSQFKTTIAARVLTRPIFYANVIHWEQTTSNEAEVFKNARSTPFASQQNAYRCRERGCFLGHGIEVQLGDLPAEQ